jgi:cell division protease FtsH
MKKFLEGLLIWLVIIVLISVAYIQFSGNVGKSKTTIPLSEFLTKLEDNDVEYIVIKTRALRASLGMVQVSTQAVLYIAI